MTQSYGKLLSRGVAKKKKGPFPKDPSGCCVENGEQECKAEEERPVGGWAMATIQVRQREELIFLLR